MQRLNLLQKLKLRELSTPDETAPFTVTALGTVTAHLTKLIIRCMQPDLTWAAFDILAGQTPSAIPGTGNLEFAIGGIQAQNVGEIQGTLYIKVTDDVGNQIYYTEAVVDPGGYIGNITVTFDMPPRNYGITVEVGHI